MPLPATQTDQKKVFAEQQERRRHIRGLLLLALAAIVSPGDEVLVEAPTYELITDTLGYLQADVRRSAVALPMFSCLIVGLGFLAGLLLAPRASAERLDAQAS